MNKFAYRNQKNAEAISKIFNKPLDKPDWYKINAASGGTGESEILIYDFIGWPYNDPAELVRALADIGDVLVRINSPGGDAFDGFAIYNALQSHKGGKVTTQIDSVAASAASYIALAGKTVKAYANSMMMIHNTWVCAVGNRVFLRDAADILEKLDESMVEIYASNSNVGKKEIRSMMDAETWLTAKEAKDKGFIDSIIDGKAARAAFDLSVYSNAPDDLKAFSSNSEIEKMVSAAMQKQRDIDTMSASIKKMSSLIRQ
jgi:ATP-dependent protease ClpP protease subunit